MNGDYFKCDPYPSSNGSLLDMAFEDRGDIWDQKRRIAESEIEAHVPGDIRQPYFTYKDDEFLEQASIQLSRIPISTTMRLSTHLSSSLYVVTLSAVGTRAERVKSLAGVEGIDEVLEQGLAAFEVPEVDTLSKASREAKDALRSSICSRTILTAARGGRLERLFLLSDSVQDPFAVRALLPYWVRISDWARVSEYNLNHEKWLAAAASLRTTLAHASRWLPASCAAARDDRLLTWKDVGSLFFRFEKEGLPQAEVRGAPYMPNLRSTMQHLEWLAEDAELAQQVADAWNAVVKRGEADLVKCFCSECKDANEVQPGQL